MLSIGILFLLIACVDFFARMYAASRGPVVIHTGPKSGPGGDFAIVIVAGLLLMGIGIYAIRHKKD